MRQTKSFKIFEISRTVAAGGDNTEEAKTATSAKFQINNATLFVPVVTLSINKNIKFLVHLKQGFRKTVSWNKYVSGISTQPKSNSLEYTVDPTFRNINRLFVLSIKNDNDDPTRNSYDVYYMPLVEIKDFNELVDNKPFLIKL